MDYCYDQIKKLEQQEKKLFQKKPVNPLQKKIEPWKEKMKDQVPEKMEQLFQDAFEKGFRYLFENGTGIIEKACSKEKRQLRFGMNQYRLKKIKDKKSLKYFEWEAESSILKNKSLAAAEGAILGLFGIGLPDIPIFLGVILKTIYEIGFSFGYGNESISERMYILSLICLAAAPEEEAEQYLENCKAMELAAEKEAVFDLNTFLQMQKKASMLLAGKIVTAKLIQGFPIIGAAGTVTNYTMISRISSVAQIEYQKRFLRKKWNGLRKK